MGGSIESVVLPELANILAFLKLIQMENDVVERRSRSSRTECHFVAGSLEESIAILKASKLEVAVTTIRGANDSCTPPLELRRYGIGAGLCFTSFKKIIERIIAEDL